MKFFADTANLEQIAYCFSHHVNDGITTNPRIIKDAALEDLKELGFERACKNLLEKYPNVPVSLETDLRGLEVEKIESYPEKVKEVLLKQAWELSSWQKNVIIKIPICSGGLLAARELKKLGIKTNITACMTPYQAIEASKVGFGYVSLFANRMLDSHILELTGYNLRETLKRQDWKSLLAQNKDKYFEQAWQLTLEEIAYVASHLDNNPNVSLIIGSIRTAEDIRKIAQAEPQVITIPYDRVKELVESNNNILKLKQTKRTIKPSQITLRSPLEHPMTSYSLEEFEQAADIYRKV